MQTVPTRNVNLTDHLDEFVVPLGQRAIYVVQAGFTPSQGAASQLELMRAMDPKAVPLTVTEGCTMVSVVGHDYMQQAGVFLDVLTLFQGAQIPVLQTSDSDFSLSCLIPESELNKAVRLLHDGFGLAQAV